jgi:hypothetical protein
MRKPLFDILVSITTLIYQSPSYEVLSDPRNEASTMLVARQGLSESGGMGGMDPQVR